MNRKRLCIYFFAIGALLICQISAFAQDIRVKCEKMTMNVPSLNTECLKSLAVTNDATNGMVAEKDLFAADPSAALISSKVKPANTALLLKDYALPDKLSPEATLYTTSDITAANASLVIYINTITNIINQNDPGILPDSLMTLPFPFLPAQDKTMLMAKKPKLLSFNNGRGVRSITAFGNPGETASAENLVYSVQGISSDGRYYVSLGIPVNNGQLAMVDLNALDWNSLPDESFSPSLTTLDELFQSIVLE